MTKLQPLANHYGSDASADVPASPDGVVALQGQDALIWEHAAPLLAVRDNDAHTLYAYALATTIAAGQQGDPVDPDTVFGPSATSAQYDTVMEYVESAHAEGARATTGGRLARLGGGLENGYFIEPTVFADVDPSMRIAREEIFGPVLSVLRYNDAVALANNTQFGLGGLVFGEGPDAALAVADRIDSGSVGLNFFASNHSAPFGGRHDSGLGTEYGEEGLAAYLSYKSIHRR